MNNAELQTWRDMTPEDVWAELQRARASEQRLLEEREDLIRALEPFAKLGELVMDRRGKTVIVRSVVVMYRSYRQGQSARDGRQDEALQQTEDATMSQTQHPQPPGRMTEADLDSFPCCSDDQELWLEARRARASEQRLLAEREEMVKALEEAARILAYAKLAIHEGNDCRGRLESCILADCCEAVAAETEARAVLTRVRAHDGEGGR